MILMMMPSMQIFLCLACVTTVVYGFSPIHHCNAPKSETFSRSFQIGLASSNNSDGNKNNGNTSLREEAESLLAKARQLRAEIETPVTTNKSSASSSSASATTTTITSNIPQTRTTAPTTTKLLSKWSVEPTNSNTNNNATAGIGYGYRLYIDIGREEGTWMEPRWGASRNRIEFTLDVEFTTILADEAQAEKLVSDNILGQKSKAYILKTAKLARLRQGFDSMKCHDNNNNGNGDGNGDGSSSGAAYRIDTSGNRQTIRFYIPVEGKQDASFGDVTIPSGRLYFSLPCFSSGGSGSSGKPFQLSSKEGIVTVWQMGWNTGWRREESRIVGVFFAKPIEEARKRDGF